MFFRKIGESFNNDSPKLMGTCSFISEANLWVQGHIKSINHATKKLVTYLVNVPFGRGDWRRQRGGAVHSRPGCRRKSIRGPWTRCVALSALSGVTLSQLTPALKHGFTLVFLLTQPSMAETLPN